MIVDEAQDFDRNDIVRLKRAATTAVYFFGDSAQSLYSFRRNTISMGDIAREVGLEAPELLMHNYRLPKTVAEIAERVGNINNLVCRCVKEGENMPEKIKCPDYNAQLDKIVEIITNLQLNNVGILFSNNQKVESAYNYLRTKGMNIEAKFDFNNGGRYRATHLDLDFASDNPKLMTYHSSKGLQFETVFIPQPTLFEDADNPTTPLYVAMTRTSDRLYLLYSGNCPTFLDAIPVNLFKNDNNIIQV
jgi:superfamily I DNA/RNA helicase